MTISERTETFFGKTVREYDPAQPVSSDPGLVYRLSLDYDAKGTIAQLIDGFLGQADRNRLEALVIGPWKEPHDTGADDVIAALVERAAGLPALRALFVGDMTYEECEISWIIQGNYQPLLQAFPRLEELRIRGSTSLQLPAFKHAALRRLVIESGGLPREVAEALAQSSLPALQHLELWLGTEDYGFSGDVALYRQVVDRLRGPGLRYLGLRDSEIADGLAQWLAREAWVEGLDTLDLSLGTLGDAGAAPLADSPHVRKLRRLDLSHHYISPPLQQRLRTAVAGVVLDDPQEGDGDDDRYVAVGE
jgi:hypothetical protein